MNLDNLRKIEFDKVKSYLANELRVYGNVDDICLYAVAYVIVKHYQNHKSVISDICAFFESNNIPDFLVSFITNKLTGKWDIVKKAKNEFNAELFIAFLLFDSCSDDRGGHIETTESITNLALKILSIRKEDYVADLAVGRGSVIMKAYTEQPTAHYYGCDINSQAVCISMMRADILGDNIEIELSDVMTLETMQNFDRVFVDCPFGVRTYEVENAYNKPLQFLNNHIDNVPKRVLAEWLWAVTAIRSLCENGKAVLVVSPNAIFNVMYKEIRKFFIDSGYVESVISFAPNLLNNTAISAILLTLSYGNKSVKLVNAIDIATNRRRKNILTDDNINSILEMLDSETSNSRLVSVEEIGDNDYDLTPERYFNNRFSFKNAVPLESVMINFSRAAQLKAAELDVLFTDEPSDVRCLQVINIKNGTVEKNLPYLKELDAKYKKHLISEEVFIISKNGPYFKTTVLTPRKGEKILVNGNVYVLKLDLNKIDPYYLIAFFESDLGQSYLKSLAVGTVLPVISVETLKKMQIPLPDMEQQQAVSKEYCRITSEVIHLREELEKADLNRKSVFDNMN